MCPGRRRAELAPNGWARVICALCRAGRDTHRMSHKADAHRRGHRSPDRVQLLADRAHGPRPHAHRAPLPKPPTGFLPSAGRDRPEIDPRSARAINTTFYPQKPPPGGPPLTPSVSQERESPMGSGGGCEMHRGGQGGGGSVLKTADRGGGISHRVFTLRVRERVCDAGPGQTGGFRGHAQPRAAGGGRRRRGRARPQTAGAAHERVSGSQARCCSRSSIMACWRRARSSDLRPVVERP